MVFVFLYVLHNYCISITFYFGIPNGIDLQVLARKAKPQNEKFTLYVHRVLFLLYTNGIIS